MESATRHSGTSVGGKMDDLISHTGAASSYFHFPSTKEMIRREHKDACDLSWGPDTAKWPCVCQIYRLRIGFGKRLTDWLAQDAAKKISPQKAIYVLPSVRSPLFPAGRGFSKILITDINHPSLLWMRFFCASESGNIRSIIFFHSSFNTNPSFPRPFSPSNKTHLILQLAHPSIREVIVS